VPSGGTVWTYGLEMVSTLLAVWPLALGSAISPVLLMLQAVTLASRVHGVARSLVVLAGSAAVVAVVVAVVIAGDRRTELLAVGNDKVVGAWIRIVLAVLLAATAVRLAMGANHSASPGEDPAADATDPGVKPARYLLLGVAAMATNATSLVLFIPALHTAVTAGLAPSAETAVVVVLCAFILAPAIVPLSVYVALGHRGPSVLAGFGNWLRVHNRTIGIVVSTGFAMFLGWAGFAALA